MAWQIEKFKMCCLNFFPCVLFQIIFLKKYVKTEKQHLDFIKYNRSIPTCGFTLELVWRAVLTDMFQKSLGSPKFELAHDIWIGSIFFLNLILFHP